MLKYNYAGTIKVNIMNILRYIDYSLYTDKERVEKVNQLLADPIPLSEFELEGLANYILYGKDESKLTNSVQQKRIMRPNTKFGSFARRNEDSLDELMENPLFDESALHEYNERNTYTKPKTTIKRPKYNANGVLVDAGDSVVPGMTELWDCIDRMARKLDIYNGKIEPNPDSPEDMAAKEWDSLTAYKMRHWLISLRQQQYYLRESYYAPIPPHHSFAQNGTIDWFSDGGYWVEVGGEEFPAGDGNCEEDRWYRYKTTPKGRYRAEKLSGKVEKWHIVREHTIDLTNPEHIYQLFEHYDALKKSSWDDLNGQMKYILMALDDLQDKAGFTDIQWHIIDRKVLKYTNERIKKELQDIFGVNYNVNYISTMYKKTICGKIANAAKLQIKEHQNKDNPYMWKKCTCCGRLLLIDPQNFVKKDGAVDGFSARCKKCDKELRDKKKQESEDNAAISM